MPGASSPLTGGGRGPDRRRVITAGTVLAGLMAVAGVVALSSRLSPHALLSVGGMEKEAKLEHMLSEKLAAQEMAHWKKLDAVAFPTTAEVEAGATRRAGPSFGARMVQRARVEQALHDKAVMERALRQQAAKDHAQMQEALVAAAKSKAAAAGRAGPASKADAKKPTHRTKVKMAVGKDKHEAAKNTPKSVATSSKNTEKTAAHTQKMLASSVIPTPGKDHASTSPAPVQAGTRMMDRLGDDVMDIPVHEDGHSADDGDVHVDSDVLGRYMFKQKHGQQLFLGEGPWVHVPVEGEMSGDGVGANVDGANGVAVDSSPMSPEAQARAHPATPPCTYLCSDPDGCDGHPGLTDGDCEETLGRDMDIEGHSWPDNYPSSYDAWTGNNHGLFKSNKVQQLAGRITLPPALRRRQRLFLGEGAWAHVPVEHEMAGDGVGANFDGANGVVVNSDPWTKEAQLRVNGAQPPCMYRCASPSGWCEGHPGLSDGDCEEVIGFEQDVHHEPQYHSNYPATYDAWTGNPNGFFKAPGALPSLRAMAAARFREAEAADNEPAGLAALAHPKQMFAGRKAPGLGSLAPTEQFQRLKQIKLHQQQQMLEGEEEGEEGAEAPAHPWRPAEQVASLRHAQKCIGGNGTGPCADTYMDMPHNMHGENQGDVELDVDSIVPYMYKGKKGSPMLRQKRLAHADVKKAPLTMLADKVALGDEEFGGDDTQVPVASLKNHDDRWDKLAVHSTSGSKLSALQKKALAARTALTKVDRFKELPVGEYRTHTEVSCIPGGPCTDEVLDGLESNVVNVTTADCTSKEDCTGHTWESYFFKHKDGGAMLAKKIEKKFIPAHKLEEASLDGMSDQMVSVNQGHVDSSATPRWTKFYSPPVAKKAVTLQVLSNASLGDETLDTTDNVHVDADKVGTGPHAGELQWDTFYSGKVVHGGQEAARKAAPKGKPAAKQTTDSLSAGQAAMLAGSEAYADGGHMHFGFSDEAANKDIDNFWKQLDNDPDHGSPKLV